MSCKESLIKYIYQCLFFPPKQTLIANIKNNKLTTWPGPTIIAVERYLPTHAPATDKGHMKRHKKGIQSMKQKLKENLESIEVKRCINPLLEQEKWINCLRALYILTRKMASCKQI